MVVLLDDVTELSIAQSTLAWREVARRIAHEIKNPLTPLQLSAQRLQRLFADSELDELVRDLTLTIVEHVDSIKRLANEFSNFARMPAAEFREADLNQVLADVVMGYTDDSPAITLQFIPDSKLPRVICDSEQVRRILINLIDNAVAALRDADSKNPKIIIRTRFEKRRQVCFIEVADNGPGIAQGDKTRIFNPYYTTKKGGTGLGLAIVSSAVSDHHGRVSVADNAPRGAKFVIELPVQQHIAVTQRSFGSQGVSEESV
jgi:two-component system nitrogen regulation sensor histidine kinase NtrY